MIYTDVKESEFNNKLKVSKQNLGQSSFPESLSKYSNSGSINM